MPIGVAGKQSPPSIVAVMTFADTPFTFSLRYFGSIGEWSSNHCASALIVSVRRVASSSRKFTRLSHEAR